MAHQLQQIAFVGVFFIVPGAVGGWLAWTKGRNPFLWFLLNTFFPPTLMVTIFQGPVRSVPGHYRRCPKCGEYSRWRASVCRFCQTDLSADT